MGVREAYGGIQMNKNRQRIVLGILTLMLLVFTGCKGESPTAPSPTPLPPTGGTPPPVGATVTLTASTTTPALGSITTISATVTVNNQPAPAGTAVEFSTNFGTFDGGGQATIRTTNANGVATVTLSSATAGPATITAVVNNVQRQITVTFQPAPPTPTPPPTITPTVVSIFPLSGRPQGGEIITIVGTNFRAPMRVVFDFGGGILKEAFIVPGSITPTSVQVVTPSVDLGRDENGNLVQSRQATITVFTEAGTPNELRAVSPQAFTYVLEVLTPLVTTLSPATGPLSGGTRVTIFGDGFQAPAQVFFGFISGNVWFEMQVINVTINQIIAITPPGRDIGQLTAGPIDLKIVNIRSNTRVEVDNAFVYSPQMFITAISPGTGTIAGGTAVQIDGSGFDDPVVVSIGGLPAQPLRVSGTQILAATSAVPATGSCAGPSGAVSVTNVETGETASGPIFSYIAPRPLVVSLSADQVIAGGTVVVGVRDALPGTTRITIAGRTLIPTATSVNTATGVTSFTVTVPTNITFSASSPCVLNGFTGTQLNPILSDVSYLNVDFGCTNTLTQAVTVFPVGSAIPPLPAPQVLTPPCVVAPSATVSPASPTCAASTAVSATGTATGSGTFTVTNNSATTQNLQLTNGSTTATTNATTVTVSPTFATIAPGASTTFTITVDPTAAGAFTGTATFVTNAPGQGTISACLSGTATP